jgi:hypothetical protein
VTAVKLGLEDEKYVIKKGTLFCIATEKRLILDWKLLTPDHCIEALLFPLYPS